MKDGHKTSKSEAEAGQSSIGIYAVQCGECFKWRVIPTQEEFEDIRSRSVEDPFFCHKKPNASCDDPADIEYDATRMWVVDKPNIPKTPAGFQRGLVLRKDHSKFDANYTTPTGKKVRGPSEVASFIESNPEYKDLSVSDFSFWTPKIMDDTVPQTAKRKGSASKRVKTG
ncbi:methyl-CpG-binding domain-containing protein 4-like isoform X2 [Cornus florida]|uniref:methyl-CpG-binding domain-containing protein 4-like isoform X2 n=1 Tax=Cornus florida TaxID=4283 RepID=UPI0028A2A602|nr:methyl-CpG-binding domain-containing protein 4-like isoform X2 [Cornus florida]